MAVSDSSLGLKSCVSTSFRFVGFLKFKSKREAGEGGRMAGDAEGAVKPPDAKCMYHCRMLLALTATIVLIIGIAMQVRFHLPILQPRSRHCPSGQWRAASTADTRS